MQQTESTRSLWVAMAVMVVVPPRLTKFPLIVIELLANEAFGMLDKDRLFVPPKEVDAEPEIPPE